MSFRDALKTRTRNLEIPRCAIAHLRSGPSDHPGMTEYGAVLLGKKQKPRSPLPPRALARGGEGSGVGGLSACSSGRKFAEPPPTPDPSPPLRGGRGNCCRSDGGLFDR